ncbi:threonine-phosphate decarboxylase CobD [Aneurinibacillus sp. Ricciae_BoGa-3]|uniref:threonine-phosphate decarboxylase CobD n=1 Tax=Aneurinibacillus sp. Ricciae_BoGa-3 TaxID=3022697 RepID=UPI002341C609|nr:threonine-phosphate decarboxylase CobD [Aneurinibacillus sp. Ricciae_BoGa-3]WCK53992.1 threonine-phosphate decarboxylase CobD [Aneurinibacillus sp. Ricciae_BoGa-3]
MRIEQYGHGGDRITAAEAFNRREDEFLDFSANINPLGPPPHVLARIQHHISSIIHYPDPAHRLFKQRLADRLQVDESSLLVGNGAAECMALALLAFQPKKVGVMDPCFSEYRSLAEQFGAQVESVQGLPEEGFLPELEQVHPLFSRCDLIFVGHPNNPTGMMYTLESLQTMARWAEASHTWLVIDEAFIDFLPEAQQLTLLHSLDVYTKVILIRSLTKFYAIPGLRLGFSAAHPEAIRRMKGVQVTWSVNSLALAAGEACLQETDYHQNTRELIATERDYLSGNIQEELGWKVWPGKANFLLVRLPDGLTAEELQLRLGLQGILIRNCSMYRGLTAHDFRIAVRNREDNEKLLHAFIQTVNERAEGEAE